MNSATFPETSGEDQNTKSEVEVADKDLSRTPVDDVPHAIRSGLASW